MSGRAGASALITAGDNSDLVSFPSFLGSHLQTYHESSAVVACVSFMESYLGIRTESRNKKARKQAEVSIWLLSPGRSQRARERLWVPNLNLSQLLKWPKLSVSITDLFSPREFPNGEDGQSRCAACHRTPARSFPAATRLHFSHSTIHTFWVSPTPA